MENHIFRFLAALLLSMPVFVSCQRENVPDPAPEDGEKIVRLTFNVLPNSNVPFTKSIIVDTAGETVVKDINVWIYRDRLLYRQYYRTATSDTTIVLDKTAGHSFYFIALANVGKCKPTIKIDSLIDPERFWMEGITPAYMKEHGLPMVCADSTFNPASGLYTIKLERAVARYDFKIDRSRLKGTFEVTNVALCQSRNCFNLLYSGQQFATSTDQVEKGDSSSAADVTALNSDKQVTFYALLNEHGELLSGNTDPWKKIPESLIGRGGGPLDSLCTYIHLKGVYKDSVLTRKMDYRFYLGANATSDFSVSPNTRYTVTFSPCDSTTTKLGNWKIEGHTEGTDAREIKIGALQSSDILSLAAGKDTTLSFTANCAVDTLSRFSQSGITYLFKKKPAFNDIATDSLKISAAVGVPAQTEDSLKFATYDRCKIFTLKVKIQ